MLTIKTDERTSLVQTFVRTCNDRSSWPKWGDADNIGLPQAGPDQLSSASVLYQSFVVGLDRFIFGFLF